MTDRGFEGAAVASSVMPAVGLAAACGGEYGFAGAAAADAEAMVASREDVSTDDSSPFKSSLAFFTICIFSVSIALRSCSFCAFSTCF